MYIPFKKMNYNKKRRKTNAVLIGNSKKNSVFVGGFNPIVIQSMCNTKTEDWKTTVEQIHALEKEKCEMIRVAVPHINAAKALPGIKKHIHIPLVADIHFNHRLAIESIKNGADKIRINPGNIGCEEKVKEIVHAAKKAKTAIRVGVNAGSLEKNLLEKYGHPTPEALVESALKWIKFFKKQDFKQIVISLKTSDVIDTIKAYRLFVEKSMYPLHIGVTEAGTFLPGAVRNSIGIGTLLQEGIGDTIRVSATCDPVEQVKIAKEILKALHLYDKEPIIISCPTCSRTEIDVEKLSNDVRKRTAHIRKPLKIAVLGCEVNGPGESKESDYGIAGGRKKGTLYRKGKIVKTVPEGELLNELLLLIENK